MTLQLSLPAELEAQLRQRAAEEGVKIEKFVEEAVIDRLDAMPKTQSAQRSPEEFREALQRIIAKFPGSGGNLDDSRESIYAGRE